jgi:serine protease
MGFGRKSLQVSGRSLGCSTGRLALVTLLVVFAGACFASHPDVDGSSDALSEETGQRFLIKLRDYGRGVAGVTAAGGHVVLELPAHDAVAANLPDGAIAALRRNPAVERIERDPIRTTMAETMPWGIPRVQADSVLDGSGGAVVGSKKVCIIDGGYYLGHEDLPTSNVTGEPAGWDTSSCAHGTHVAGTIAALGGNATGVVGVLPAGVPIHAVQVFGGTDCGWTYGSDLIAAVDACVAAGAQVINMSLGGGGASTTEEEAFVRALDAGVLSFAAAGNDGNTVLSYPASYSVVISVGATTDADDRASFSQHNDQVELSAPGQSVLSTVPYRADSTLTTATETFTAGSMEGSIQGSVTGSIADGGDCNTRPRRNAFSGQIVLCQRGGETFRTKVGNAERGGAVGVLVYNNVAGGFGGTLGTGKTINIPSATLSDTQGAAALTHLGEEGTLTVAFEAPASGYDTYDGTSMATPHAAGVAALVWSAWPTATAQQVRSALIATADDLGTAGRDVDFGYGLVQAYDAVAYLSGAGPAINCVPTAGQEVVESTCDDGVDDDCDGDADAADSDCAGGGGGSTCGDLGLPGDPCEVDADCCLNICRGRTGHKSCR